MFFTFSKLVVLLFLINTLASFLNLYYIFPWFDNVSHFLGGLTTSALIFFFMLGEFVVLLTDGRTFKIFRIFFLLLLIVVIGWEVLEYLVQDLFGVEILAQPNDSYLDIVMGVIGGFVGYFTFLRRIKKENSRILI